MSADKYFLTKYHLFNNALTDAARRNYNTEHGDKPFTGLESNFCEMVIKKSQIVKWPAPEAHSTTLEQLCGMIPDEAETNRYYYMARVDLHPYRNIVVYELLQHHNSDIPVSFTLEVDADQFNEYLNFIFSYCDPDCMEVYIYNKFKEKKD